MPAITPTDLTNAKTDVDKISEFMESSSLTMTTRLGASTKTRSGLIAELEADAAVTATALNRAAAEEAQAGAEEARDAAINAVSTNGALVDGLIGDETTAIAIHAFEADAYAMKTIDASNPANNRTGRVTDTITGWTNPKLTIQSDGHTLKHSPHQLAKQTDAPTTSGNLSGASAVAAADTDGFLKAATLTATSTPESAHKQLALSASAYNDMYHMVEAIVKAGTSTFGYIGYNDGADKLAYFNFSTWAAGTVHASITFEARTDYPNGTALPSGYRRVTAYFKKGTGTITTLLGMCDADAAKTVTLGRTFTFEKFHLHLGVRSMTYVENTGTSAKILEPVDYSKGSRRIVWEPAALTFDGLHSEDLTQAAWVKTNCTAAFTSTGPSGAPCSRLTATAADATCLQTLVSASTSRVFTPFIKRVTGTGVIEAQCDAAGTTWVDVTSQLSTTRFKRVVVNGGANPIFGFRIRASGDAIDVGHANSAPTSVAPLPVPVGASSLVRAADTLTIIASLVTNDGTSWTVFVDYERGTGTGFPDDGTLRIGKADLSQEAKLGCTSSNGQSFFSVDDGPTTKTHQIYVPASGERMELTVKLKAGDHAMSINGDPTAYIKASSGTTVGMPTVEQIRMAGSGPIYLRRLLAVPSAIDNDDVRTWRCQRTTRNNVLDVVTVAEDSDAEVPNTSMNRAPSLCVLSDDGETADLLHFFCQKRAGSWHHTEAPMRLMSRKYRMTKSTGRITALTAAAVIQQQAGWATGDGHLQSPAAIVIPSGTYAGRVVATFTGLENPTFSPDKRSFYTMYNEAGRVNPARLGDPTGWTTPVKVIDAASGTAYIGEPSGCLIMLPSTHPVAPNRIITTVTVIPGGAKTVYSDDYGQTWTQGTLFAPAGIGVDETNLSVRPDGTLVFTYRTTTAPTTRRGWATSTDGGANLVDQGFLTGWSYSASSAGIVQMDPTGVLGTAGKIAISHPASATNRYGVQIDFIDDAAMTLDDSYEPWPEASDSLRYYGYSSIKSLFGGTHLALAVEGGSVAFNTDNTQYLALIEAP